MTNSFSTIDSHLPIEEEEDIQLPQLESEPPKVTKHSLSTSPWSRLLIIAVPFGLVFLIIFLFLGSIFNPSDKEQVKATKQSQETSTSEEKMAEQDGDVYAKLALSDQEDELNKLNNKNKQEQLPEVETEKAAKTVSNPTPPPRAIQRPVQRATPPTAPRVRETAARVSSPPQRSFVTPKVTHPAEKVEVKPIDPTAEFLRLRNIGSYGLVAYTDTNSLKTSKPSSSFPDPAQSAPQTTRPRTTVPTATTPSNTNTIEKIRPRWPAENKMVVASNYLPQENQILQERRTRYLTVGKFASGVMVTPAVKEQAGKNNDRQQTDDGRRFVAKLTEDLHDNYGDIAIPAGSLLAVELVSVDGGNYAQMQVTSIIKDNTEYPITKGAIAVQGDKGKPLIAKKYHDKGRELASQDLTVALLGGLSKVGEIINRPDTQSSFQTSSIGSSSSVTTQNNRRNIVGALLEGAFGEMSEIVRDRAEQSTQEILSRPNVYYIPRNTKVTFIVNRTLELP